MKAFYDGVALDMTWIWWSLAIAGLMILIGMFIASRYKQNKNDLDLGFPVLLMTVCMTAYGITEWSWIFKDIALRQFSIIPSDTWATAVGLTVIITVMLFAFAILYYLSGVLGALIYNFFFNKSK